MSSIPFANRATDRSACGADGQGHKSDGILRESLKTGHCTRLAGSCRASSSAPPSTPSAASAVPAVVCSTRRNAAASRGRLVESTALHVKKRRCLWAISASDLVLPQVRVVAPAPLICRCSGPHHRFREKQREGGGWQPWMLFNLSPPAGGQRSPLPAAMPPSPMAAWPDATRPTLERTRLAPW